MEEHRYVLPSNVYPSYQPSLDIDRPRLPLTDSSGNAQYHTVATTNLYNDRKGLQPRPPPNFSLPTLPSQPARPLSQRRALEARRAHIRTQKAYRGSKPNPFIDSEHYQAYRSRQVKGDDEEQKWPDDLEDLFLEALCLLPNMGRRKFSLNGKPRGRNELISLYLWIGHNESLAPGQKPDPSRQRTRKQVSSHIQVLKGFMRGHPAFDRLFPPKDAPRKDSFKNDPCLRALAQGRLPHTRSNQFDFASSMGSHPSRQLSSSPSQLGQELNEPGQALRPALFKMYMTTLRPGVEFEDVPEDDTGDGKLSTRVHTYSDSVPRALGFSTLEILLNWRARFPTLAQIYARNDLKCDIIHMEASLELRYGSLPERSELWGKFELLIPGKRNPQAVWRCTQSLYKPADLYGTPNSDPPFENVTSTPHIDRYEPGVGIHIRVSFPASPWAYALQRLSTMEAQFEEAVQTGAPIPTPTTARQYIDQITMFQEIFCSPAPSQPFVRKAILLWTFKKCKAGEQGQATWRYLDPAPLRSACFSPHPGNIHVVSAAMAENFGAWADNNSIPQPLHLPATGPSPFDDISQLGDLPPPLNGLVSSSGETQFPFSGAYGYPSAGNINFVSHETQDSDATLVDVHHGAASSGGGVGVQIDSFLSSASASVGVLGGFDYSGQNLWEAPPSIQHFETDLALSLAGYGTVSVPSNAEAQVWDTGDANRNGKCGGGEWDVTADETGFAVFEASLGGGRH